MAEKIQKSKANQITLILNAFSNELQKAYIEMLDKKQYVINSQSEAGQYQKCS